MAVNLLEAHRNDQQVRAALLTHKWRHDLCGCFDNCGMCIIAYFVPCVTFGQTAEARGKNCCLWGCLYLLPCAYICAAVSQRTDLRNLRGIPGSCCGDLMCAWFCHFCVLVQERQESEHIQTDLLQILAARQQEPPAVQVVVRQVGGGYVPQNVAYPPHNTGLPPQGNNYEAPPPSYEQANMEPNADTHKEPYTEPDMHKP